MLNYMNVLNNQHLLEKIISHEEEQKYIKGVPSFTRILYFIYLSRKNNHVKTEDVLLNEYLSNIHYLVWIQIDSNHLLTLNAEGDVFIGSIIEKIDDPFSTITNKHVNELEFILNFENQSLLASIEILNTIFQTFELKTNTWKQFIHRLYDQSYKKLSYFYKYINLDEQGMAQYRYSKSVYFLINSLYIFYLLEPFIILKEEGGLYLDKSIEKSIKSQPLNPLFLYCDYLLISFDIEYNNCRAMSIISSHDIVEMIINKEICYTKENHISINIDDLFG